MKFIYKIYRYIYIYLGFLGCLLSHQAFGMEEGRPAKKQKIDLVPTLKSLCANKIAKPLKNLEPITFMRELNDMILPKLPTDLHTRVVVRGFIPQLKNMYLDFYTKNLLFQFLFFAKEMKDSILDKAVTQLIRDITIHHNEILIKKIFNLLISPFVMVEIIPTQQKLKLPDEEILDSNPITLSKLWYLPQYKTLLFSHEGIKWDNKQRKGEDVKKFFAYNTSTKKLTFIGSMGGSFDIDLAKNAIVFFRSPYPVISLYKFKTTDQNIELLPKPTKKINFNIENTKNVSQVLFWPKDHIIIAADTTPLQTTRFYLFKRLAPYKFFDKKQVVDTLDTHWMSKIMVHPTENRMIIASYMYNRSHPKIIIKEIRIENDKFKVIKDLLYEPESLGMKGWENILNTYIASQFPHDNPLLWEEQRRNVKILKVQHKLTLDSILADAALDVNKDPKQEISFFGALTERLEKHIKPQPVEQQSLPTGPIGKEEE